jgi:hypothetical protein
VGNETPSWPEGDRNEDDSLWPRSRTGEGRERRQSMRGAVRASEEALRAPVSGGDGPIAAGEAVADVAGRSGSTVRPLSSHVPSLIPALSRPSGATTAAL